ncbi:SWI1-like protein [Fusarium subglutinans]|uniref:SWI1-like protein n=1 Tax=Gibberella subglutinans TaxID=42677 RepID=A0A8H5V2T9_GIBSU|nr:SWI1-like protein [Fusarium subglutinans]KAF5606755.1 SWI1-like protein [Fusarium subglutinans]
MSTWMNDAVPNHNGNGFPHMNDSNAAGNMMDPSAFMANPAQFNPAQFNQQMGGAMANGPGSMRNASPSFQNPVYQTNSVIPSKRPRPREDSLAGSPSQNPGMLPTSRSETPQQQPFAGGFQPGAVQQNPGQFSHLQPNGSANASPSPIMSNQMRPGSVPQRVATASPHPFSPSGQQFNPQTSPIPSEHGTPQPNPYMQNMAQGFNPNFAPSPSNTRPSPNPNAMSGNQMMAQQMGQMPQHMGQMQGNMFPPQMQQGQQQQGTPQQQGQQQQGQQTPQRPGMMDAQKMAAYQMRLQQQLQGNTQIQAQMQAQNMGRGVMPNKPVPGMPNGQMQQGGMRPQQRMMANVNPEQFMKNLTTLMNSKGLQLDPNPMVMDRPVNLMMLFQAVQTKGGYKQATTTPNGWPHVAQMLSLPPQNPIVLQTLRTIYERNLYKFEEVWIAQQQKQRMMQQQQQQSQQQSQQQPQQPQTPGTLMGQATPQKQMQHGQQMTPGAMGQSGPPAQMQQTPMKQMQPGQPPVNGFSTPQPQMQPQPPVMPGQNRTLSQTIDVSAVPEFPGAPSPATRRAGSMSQNEGRQASAAPVVVEKMPRLAPQTDEYSPCARELSTFGGVDLNAFSKLGAELERWKPDVPPLQELGNIDIGALTKSLQSGIHGETRLALDVLAAASCSMNQLHFIQLRYCDELIEALIECAEDQVEMLAEHTAEVSDEIQISPYEDVLRACRLERFNIRDLPVFGTQEYELDRAVDRLICVTTILRNLSFPGEQNDNHSVLADEIVIKFVCAVIRYLGTRTMLLRSHNNTLDFMKDVVILLSNIAGSVEIPGREQALCLLQFLLAFAPAPNPTVSDGTLFFTQYEPSLHAYLPHAVDALAKLLARDEPNRGHYKAVFALDSNSSPPYELLTRAFGLAIAPIPDKAKTQTRQPNLPSLVEVRKPFLMQGLLSAEILASLAPGHDSGVAQSWLSSGNDFAQNLFRLIRELSQLYEQPQVQGPRTAPRKDPELVYIVVVAVALLRRLAEKARDPNDPTSSIPVKAMPAPHALLEALSMQSAEWSKDEVLQKLSTFFALGR